MRIALLGLPQAGKRTLFTLLTGRAIPATHKPHEGLEGTARVADPRVDRLAELFQPRKITYAENQYVLCPDAIEGGGRDWYDIARTCDLVSLVVRAFVAEHVFHPAGSIDPERDRELLETEMALADLERVMNRILRIDKEKTRGHSAARDLEERALRRIWEALDSSRPARVVELNADERRAIHSLGMLTLLPVLTVLNVSEEDIGKGFGDVGEAPGGVAEPLGDAGKPPGAVGTTPGDVRDDFATGRFIVSAKVEKEIREIGDANERREYLAALNIDIPGLDRLNAAAYDALGLMSFYTVGKDEVRAWTIRKGARAPEAGGRIHSDIARGFIRVEVIKYDDLIAAGSERAVKDQGRAQLRGKDYVMEDGDICHFLFSVQKSG